MKPKNNANHVHIPWNLLTRNVYYCLLHYGQKPTGTRFNIQYPQVRKTVLVKEVFGYTARTYFKAWSRIKTTMAITQQRNVKDGH